MKTVSELLRLRVPGGWTIVSNRFVDATLNIDWHRAHGVEPIDEDILYMEYRRSWQSVQELADRAPYSVDLEWRPTDDGGGEYRLTLLGGSWENVLSSFSSADRFAVRDVLEQWLGQVIRATDHAQLVRWLAAATNGRA